jgi:hypothetical protein
MPNARILFTLLCVAIPGTCFADYWYCSFTPREHADVIYVSGVFGPFSDLVYGGKASDTTTARMQTAFTQYVAQNHGEKSGTAKCGHYIVEQSTVAERAAYEKRVRDAGGKITETDWTWAPPQ